MNNTRAGRRDRRRLSRSLRSLFSAADPPPGRRRLGIEPLEDRRLLAFDSFAAPLAAENPPGSLVYGTSQHAEIDTPGLIDGYTVELDDSQAITVAVYPADTLQPRLALAGPDGGPLGIADAAAPGEVAMLQALPTVGAGTYSVVVAGADGSVGEYSVKLLLNAAVELEEHGGDANDTAVLAEDLGPHFLAPGGGPIQRAAVLGTLHPGAMLDVAAEDFESGLLDGRWTTFSSQPEGSIQLTDAYGTAGGLFAMVLAGGPLDGANLNEAVWTVDLSQRSSAVLSFFHAEFDDTAHPLPADFGGRHDGDGVAISDDGVHWHTVFGAADQPYGEWTRYSVDLATEAARADMTVGPDFRIKFQQYGEGPLFDGGRGYDQIAITAADGDDDWYRFSLDDGQSVTLALTGLGPDDAGLELFGGGGLLAVGAEVDNFDRAISNFVDATADGGPDAYYARVSGTEGDYSLLVVPDGDFDTEPNNGPDQQAQDVTLSGTASGAIGTGSGQPVFFAAVGDMGTGDVNEQRAADMIRGWDPEFVIATGDVNCGILTVGGPGWKQNLGDDYGSFILGRSDDLYPELTSPVQRFFPAVGNHDVSFVEGLAGYLDYLHYDPQGGRLPPGVHQLDNSYYDFQWGPVHVFTVDSHHALWSAESMAAQRLWLQEGLANSTADWKFVQFHHPPFSSGPHGNEPGMDWPFAEWGADAIFTGHDHTYQRIHHDGIIHFVTALGGRRPYSFIDPPVPGTIMQFTGEYGAMKVIVDGTTAVFEFWSIGDGAYGADGGVLIDSVTVEKPLARADSVDHYSVEVNAGDVLTIATHTPGDGPLELVNLLDPAIELYDPSGASAAGDDNGAPDGRNARLTHAAATSGTYTVRITGVGQSTGEYVLDVSGHTGVSTAVEVAGVTVANEAALPAAPPELQVRFTRAVAADTLQAEDLQVNGVAAAAVAILDGRTAVFDLSASLPDGQHDVTLAAGSVLDLQGGPMGPFDGTFSIDTTPPRVIASSITEGGIAPTGSLVYTARFSKRLHEFLLRPSDVELVGRFSGTHRPRRFEYDADLEGSGSTLTVEFQDLPEDNYTLRMLSGDGRFEDLAGRDLDGEPHPLTTVPSGDGTAGGDFVVGFSGDMVLSAYPVPLGPKRPRGSRIYDRWATGQIGHAGDGDGFTIELDANPGEWSQTVSVVVGPDAVLQPTVELAGPDGVPIGAAAAAVPGEDAVLQSVAATAAGTYTVTVSGGADTTGRYAVGLVLGAAFEEEEHGGPSNHDRASAQDLDAALGALDGGSARQGAVVGRLPWDLGAVVAEEDFPFPQLGGQWTTYNSAPEGRITLSGVHGTAAGELALLMDRSSSGLAVLNEAIWTVDLTGIGQARLSFFRAAWSESTQPLTSDFSGHKKADGVAISDDGIRWHPVWDGRYQTSGVWVPETIDLAAAAADAGITLGPDFQIKFQQYGNYSLVPGIPNSYGRGFDRIAITVPAAITDDWYRFTLDDGRSATLAVSAMQAITAPTSDQIALELYDAGGNLLAGGTAAANLDRVIDNFVDGTGDGNPDVYYVRVTGRSGAEYSLLVTRHAQFEVEGRPWNLDSRLSAVVAGHAGLPPDDAAVERQKLTASEAGPFDRFGQSVSLGGRLALVGASGAGSDGLAAGAAYLLKHDGSVWTRQQRLTAADPQLNEGFGWSVSIGGDTAVVGAPYPSEGGSDAGSAHVFRLHGDRWVQQQRLTAADAVSGDLFGYAVAQSGDAMLVGANGDNLASGSAHVFRFDGTRWRREQKLTAADASALDEFGAAVALSGNTAVVGAPHGEGDAVDSGAVYVFRFDGLEWMLQQKLTAADAYFGDYFGSSVAISGDTLVVGAWRDDDHGSQSGSAYVFHFDGDRWVEQQKLVAADAAYGDWFGMSVSLSGDVLVVGASGDDDFAVFARDVGSAYLFRFDGSRWTQQQKLVASRPDVEDFLGGAAATDGRTVILGANGDDRPGLQDSGAAYTFSVSSPWDGYGIEATAGDVLELWTSTPGDGPGEFVNLLDPALEVYDPAGRLVAEDDNGAADRRNAMLTHAAAADGTYTVRVLPAAGTQGEYVLRLGGHTGPPPAFEVTATDPPGGNTAFWKLDQIQVHFNDQVLATSLDAADLTVGGVPAQNVTLAGGYSAIFDLPGGLADGHHELAIAAGSIVDLQGTPVGPFAGSLVLQTAPPQIVQSWLLSGDVVPAGELVYTARFTREMKAAGIDPSDVELMGRASGAHAPVALGFGPDGSLLTVRFAGLPEDAYTLKLQSGDGRFEDFVGRDLDGEPHWATTIPTGDGWEGGDFLVDFSTDADQTDARELQPLPPLGSLISLGGGNTGLINLADDVDDFMLAAAAGEIISAVAVPEDPAATLSIELPGLAGPFAASAPGGPAVLPGVAVAADGTYAVRVSGDVPGEFRLEIGKNLVSEAVDSEDGRELPIDGSYLALGSGRYAVLGGSGPGKTELIVNGGFETGDSPPSTAVSNGLAVDQRRLDLPDVDEFTLDLTGKAGRPIDVVLAGQDGIDFSGELLELLDVDGMTVLATAVPDPMGIDADNLDLAVFDFQVPGDGLYTLRVTSAVGGRYALVVTDSLSFDAEPDDALGAGDPLRNLDRTGGALGYLDAAGDLDLYEITLAVGDTLVVHTETPLDGPAITPANGLDPALGLIDPTGAMAAADTGGQDGKNARLVFAPIVAGTYTIGVLAQQEAGTYLLSAEVVHEPLPWISIHDAQAAEGDQGAAGLVFDVTLSHEPPAEVTVRFDTADGTATLADADYSPIGGLLLRFDPGGGLTRQVTVELGGDVRVEPDETLLATLSGASGGILADLRALGTILNDDAGQVVGRHLFYNDSAFDGDDPAANPQDDDAIAVDKQALLPGGTASFVNYSSFSGGINGVMVDLLGLPEWNVLDPAEFSFRVGNNDDPATWEAAPDPIHVSLRRGDGLGGSDRVTILWDRGAIQKQWLQVVLAATENNALDADDVFYFGNAIGETGDSAIDAKVTPADMLGARDNQRHILDPAPIDFNFDFSRDARVNTVDMLIARDNQTHFLNALKLITVPDGKAVAAATAPHTVVEHFGDAAAADWLHELAQASTRRRPSTRPDPAEAALRVLLATGR